MNILRISILGMLLAGAVALGSYVFFVYTPCRQPLHYTVGTVDEEFDISTSTFRNVVEDAERIWEEAADKELFVHDPAADFTVNLRFDKRQQRTIQSRRFEQQLESLRGAREEVLDRYRTLVDRYEQRKSDVNDLDERYQERLRSYNEKVERWNEEGGAPPDVYDELTQEKEELEQMSGRLERQRQELQQLADQINTLARREQNIISEYNETTSTYEKRYGGAREFEQGRTTPGEINIYQYRDASDLKLVLVHELGHVLGLGHVDDSTAVMHSVMQDQPLDPIRLTQADARELTRSCQSILQLPW